MRTTLYRNGDKAPDGYHWIAVPERNAGLLAWRLSDGEHRCRAGASRHIKACGRPAMAALNRRMTSSGRDNWWHYCEEHMFGRWIEDGQIWTWVLREIGETS